MPTATQGAHGRDAPPESMTAASPASAAASAAGSSVRLPPMRQMLTIIETAVKSRSVPCFGTFVSSTIIKVV